MKRINRFLGFTLVAIMLFSVACKHPVPEAPGPGTPTNGNNNPVDTGQPCDPNAVYFQRDVLPILLSNCTMSGCHDAASRQDGVVLDSYANVMATADVRPGNLNGSDLYEVITENDPRKRMPQQPRPALTSAQISIIGQWIQQGAKNEICGTTTCDSTKVTYSGTIRPLVQTNCIGCHSGVAASGGLDFSTHGGLFTVANNGRLIGAVSHKTGYQPMPQGGKLSDCQVALIKKWVGGGAPNN